MKKQQKTLLLWVVVILMMAFVMKTIDQGAVRTAPITFSQFVNAVENGNVKEVTFQGDSTILGRFNDGYNKGETFQLTGNTGDETFRILRAKGIVPNYKTEEKQGLLSTILINWFPMILLFVVFYFFLIRPQMRRQKEHQQLVQGVSKGDEVVTNGGLLGRVTDIGDTFIKVEIAKNVEVRLQRQAVSAIMPKGTIKEI
jgi:preprotein translocase YajC subunit